MIKNPAIIITIAINTVPLPRSVISATHPAEAWHRLGRRLLQLRDRGSPELNRRSPGQRKLHPSGHLHPHELSGRGQLYCRPLGTGRVSSGQSHRRRFVPSRQPGGGAGGINAP